MLQRLAAGVEEVRGDFIMLMLMLMMVRMRMRRKRRRRGGGGGEEEEETSGRAACFSLLLPVQQVHEGGHLDI